MPFSDVVRSAMSGLRKSPIKLQVGDHVKRAEADSNSIVGTVERVEGNQVDVKWSAYSLPETESIKDLVPTQHSAKFKLDQLMSVDGWLGRIYALTDDNTYSISLNKGGRSNKVPEASIKAE